MEFVCPRCKVPGTLPETPGILPGQVICGNCQALSGYRGTLLELISSDNENFEDFKPFYSKPKYRTTLPKGVPTVQPQELTEAEILKKLPTQVLLRLLGQTWNRSDSDFRCLQLGTYGTRWVSDAQLRAELSTREHLPLSKNQQRALDAVKAKTLRETPKYMERDGYVVICYCHRILNDAPKIPTEDPAVFAFICRTSRDRILYNVMKKERV